MGLGIFESLACILVVMLALSRKPVGWSMAAFALIVLCLFEEEGSAGWLLAPLFVVVVAQPFVAGRSPRFRKMARFLSLSGVALTVFLCWLFPVPLEPKFPGPHGVGTFAIELPEVDGSPALKAQLWYPCGDDIPKERLDWFPDGALVPRFPFHRIAHSRISAKSYRPAARAGEPLKVIFYEHGWMGHRFENVAQLEALASAGYVIVAIDHPGQALRTRFDDGKVVTGNLPPDPPMDTPQQIADFQALAENCIAGRIAQIERVRLALATGVANKLGADIDTDHVGIFGFSFGGSTAVRICATNPHFVAGANEDGFVFGDQLPATLFLFFDDELPSWLLAPAAKNENPEQAFIRASENKIREAVQKPGCVRKIIEGASHESFTDRIFLCRIPRLAKAGKKSAEEMHTTIVTALNQFFHENLR